MSWHMVLHLYSLTHVLILKYLIIASCALGLEKAKMNTWSVSPKAPGLLVGEGVEVRSPKGKQVF